MMKFAERLVHLYKEPAGEPSGRSRYWGLKTEAKAGQL